MLLHLFYLKTGSLELILKIPYEYNHIFPFLASLGLFCLFLDSSIQGKIGSVAVRIAPYTLGVYLLHENLGVRYGPAEVAWCGANRRCTAVAVVDGTCCCGSICTGNSGGFCAESYLRRTA